jgi:hypothetical protein
MTVVATIFSPHFFGLYPKSRDLEPGLVSNAAQHPFMTVAGAMQQDGNKGK